MDRTKLLETLEVVGKGLEKNSLIPDFDFFHFIDNVIYAGHEDFTIVNQTVFKTKDPFAVHGPTLLAMIRATKSKDAVLQVVSTKTGFAAHLGFNNNSEFELPYVGPETFIWKKPELRNTVVYHNLQEGLAACLITCSHDLALEGFNRICLGEYKGKLAMYSCDGDSLTRFVTDTKCKMTETVCVSRAFADIIVKIAGKGNPEFMIGSEHIKVATDDGMYEIYGKNLGPSTMNYESVIAGKVGEGALHGLIPFPGKNLNECLDRARVLTNIETAPTEVVVEDGNMYLQTETQRGNALDSLRTSHSDIELSISAEKVQEALEGCNLFKFTPTCSVFSAGEKLLRIVGNFGDSKGGADG